MKRRGRYRDVGQLRTCAGTLKQESTPAHVSAANELRREKQPFSKNLKKRCDVFWCRNAAEKNELGIRPRCLGENPQIAVERTTVTHIPSVNVTCANLAQLFKRNRCVGRN